MDLQSFTKKRITIVAAQWFKNGDHPEDDSHLIGDEPEQFLSEGGVVRRFRRPDVPGDSLCEHESCQKPMDDHGWIDTLEGGHIVCPGDWIITGVEGERYPCKPSVFEASYEPASDEGDDEAATATAAPPPLTLVPQDPDQVDAASFAARTAHVAAGELFGLLMTEDARRLEDWFGSQRGDLEADVEDLTGFITGSSIDNPETVWLHGVSRGIVRREADRFKDLGFARRQAFGIFTRTCLATFKAIKAVQDALEQQRRTIRAAAAHPPLAREDSILEDEGQFGDMIPGAEEVLERDRRRFNGADPSKFDHDGDGRPGGSKPAADAAAQKAAEGTNPGTGQAGQPQPLSIGETPAKPPAGNKGGRPRKSTK